MRKAGKATFLEVDVADNASVTAAAREFGKAADHLDVLVNNAGIIVDGDNAILEISDELLRKTLGTKYARHAARDARVCAFARKKQSAAHDQCLQWRRVVDRRRGRSVAGLLHFENCAQRCDIAAGHRIAKVCCEFSLPRLGAHGYGRRSCEPFS